MEGLIETVIKYAPVVLENPTDYQARAQIAMAASLAVVFMCGFERNSCGADHGIENPLTTMHHLAHGTTSVSYTHLASKSTDLRYADGSP